VGLSTYRQKRKFDVTAEPRGAVRRRKGRSFVVQKHDATRMHYDFRLEHEGVLKSWAVTKGPSLVPGEKRLAVHVEDHPVEYGAFEGTIPKGQYGGGTVMLWDRGTWEPEGDPDKGFKKGHLVFDLDGAKLKGRWHLVRMHGRPNEKRENWLLIKGDDEAAREAGDPDILDQKDKSVATKRSMEEIAAGRKPKVKTKVKAAAVWNSVARKERAAPPVPPLHAKERTGGRRTRGRGSARSAGRVTARRARAKARLPDFVPPCLARLEAQAPDGAGWVHEIKFDGYRIQARLDGGEVALLTRKGLDWAKKFKPVADAVAALSAGTALIDGEIVVEVDGVSDFSTLQADISAGRKDRFVYCVFDLLHLDGIDYTARPLIERKAALKELLADADPPLRYSEHLDDPGRVVLSHACKMTLEGIISKRAEAPYHSGRTGDWIKSKCNGRQEFVIGGFVPSTVMPRAVGSLAMGYFEDGRFVYAGRVGTGFNHDNAAELYRELDRLRVATPPFDERLPPSERRRKAVRWVAPRMVAEIEFRGFTGDKMLRHAAFKGVRADKNAAEVIREEVADMAATTDTGAAKRKSVDAPKPRGAAKRAKTQTAKAGTRKVSTAESSSARTPATSARTAHAVAGVTLTHPERVYWDDVGITKQDLADFYADIWDWLAPHVVRRPLALLRCPDGAGENCFVQKHAHSTFDRSKIISVDDHGEEVIAIDRLEGLIALVQSGVLEVHVWGTSIDRLDLCDRLVFDLDPGPGVDWKAVIAAAREVRRRLDDLGLESFIKTSGGKGLHVVAPIAGAPWDEAKEFSHAVALEMAADSPDKYVSKMTKSLRQGKIFVDYLRNGRGATAVAAYSSRARKGAPVSAPIAWEELKPTLTADKFTVLNLRQRLARLKDDPWAEIAAVKQKLPNLRKQP
jgi:bifunctional non-homologous end joining protein LigD